jgi:hypothetical protein
MSNIKVVVCNIPKLSPHYLPPSLAVLKGGCNFLNIPCVIKDFNLDFVNACISENILYDKEITGITENTIKNAEFKILVDGLINKWAVDLVNESADLIGISVFSLYGQYFAKHLAQAVKKLNPNAKIIMGGAGLTDSITTDPRFGRELKEQGIITDYIHGDAEIAWPMFLSNFFSLPLDPASISGTNYLDINYRPDFSDYEIEKYNSHRLSDGYLWLPVTGSRGCVRNCTFCEVPATWKYTQRSAKNIANEIQSVLTVADNLYIHFTDSLVNGSLSTFNELLDYLIELQKFKSFKWGGQYIVRQGQIENWAKIAASGVERLEIGFETGSDSLRFEMAKRFYNSDMMYVLGQLEKYNVKCVILMFCGYPTETLSQFQETLDFFTNAQQYASTSIEAVQLNFSFCVYKNTPLYNNRAVIKLQTSADPAQWYCASNPELTLKERTRRRLITQEHLEKLNYTLASSTPGALEELVVNYSRGNNKKSYTLDQVAQEVLGRETTIKFRFPVVDLQ